MISTKYPIYATFYRKIQRSQMCYSGFCEGYLGDHSDPDDNCNRSIQGDRDDQRNSLDDQGDQGATDP